ncbi:stalk domain-containing protein [Paenibacillus sp. Marseille-Q4541]|uniref:stalk domain-containing protein n=1 Tax=Paenibacillus sp. Marseille-Q4541 TaxID=2831522 RepID=UPI001BAA6F30|nr:stalk domain-containing protein [Paenibacillus sp. Marseille-Q4541]
MKRVYNLKIGAAVIVAALLLTSQPLHGEAASSPSYELILDSGGAIEGKAVIKKGISYLPLQKISKELKIATTWDKSGKKITLVSPIMRFAVRLNSKQATLNGKGTVLTAAPFKNGEEIYVPASFLITALHGDGLKYDVSTKKLSATGIYSGNDPSVYSGLKYELDQEGQLFVTNAKGTKKQLYDFKEKTYSQPVYQFSKTDQGLIILNISDIYGEPMVNKKNFTVVIKNGAVIRQSHVSYFKRFEDNAVLSVDKKEIVLTDGEMLRILEDGTGKIRETYDLKKLGGEDETYSVEVVDKEYLLIRPNQTGLLTYIDRKTGERTLLYKKLLSEADQEYAEMNDVPYYGDQIRFRERKGNTLTFDVAPMTGAAFSKTIQISPN